MVGRLGGQNVAIRTEKGRIYTYVDEAGKFEGKVLECDMNAEENINGGKVSEEGAIEAAAVRRDIPAKEKCKAVLAIWTEHRKVSELCRELGVNRIQVLRWEEQALEDMLQFKARKAGPELKALSRHTALWKTPKVSSPSQSR